MKELKLLYQPTDLFSKKLDQVRVTDPPGYKRVQKVIDRLLFTPGNADGKMTGVYNGRLKKYAGRQDYRIIYHWCQLCRKENSRVQNKCRNCPNLFRPVS
jgi:hypothetical protein